MGHFSFDASTILKMLYLSWAVFSSVSGSQPGYGASILVTGGFLNVASSKHALWKELPEKILKIVNDFSYKQTNFCICFSLLCVRKKNFKTVSAHTESKKINLETFNSYLCTYDFYVPETHIMYLTHCCWFLKIPADCYCFWGGGGWYWDIVHILYPCRWWQGSSTGM